MIEDGLLIGKIERIQDGGVQALFQVKKSDGKLALIPIHDDFILEVNRDLKRIIVKLPGGVESWLPFSLHPNKNKNVIKKSDKKLRGFIS